MKSFITNSAKAHKYPCLKQSSISGGLVVVLFTRPQCGICVHTSNAPNEIGEYSEIWDEEGAFGSFNSTIELSNN